MWVASYPSSGGAWLSLLLSGYFADAREELHLEALDRIPDVISVLNEGRISPADEATGPVVLRTPFPPHCDVMQLYRSTTRKIIYLVRNPRDVLLSSIPYLGIAPERAAEFARIFIDDRGAPQWMEGWGTWLSSVQDWTDAGNVTRCFPDAELMVVRYEDLRAGTIRTLSAMLEFLDAGPIELGRVRQAVEFSSLEHVQSAQVELSRGSGAAGDGAWLGPTTQCLQNQSLAHLGDDVEAAFRRAVRDDPVFAGCLHRHGYELGIPAGRA